MKQAFSLLEIIFTITIISILLVVAVPKIFDNINQSNNIKLQSDISIIRNAISKFTTQQALKNTTITLETLDENNNELFSSILDKPILSKPFIAGHWSQDTSTTYQAWITSTQAVLFSYNNETLEFNCNKDCQYCQELTK